jgi:hypothetical protein
MEHLINFYAVGALAHAAVLGWGSGKRNRTVDLPTALVACALWPLTMVFIAFSVSREMTDARRTDD